MDVSRNEVTAFAFDLLKKRMLVGDSKGNVSLHNTANGAKIKLLPRHNGEVSHLLTIQCDGAELFLSCGTDGDIRIFK